MSAANLMSVRDDAQAIQDYVADLKNWEKDIKEEDKRLLALQKDEPSMTSKDPAPIRGSLRSTDSEYDGFQKKELQLVAGVKEGKKRIQSSDYAAWDKYDAEAAVDTIEKQATKPVCDDGRLQTATLNNSPSSTEATDEDKLKAIKLKDEGNRLYSAGQYATSVTQYSQGLALDPSNHILYANRAMAYIKQERLEAAVRDCDACLRLSPNYLKAWMRRGAARLSLGQLQHALEDYQKVLEVEPWNKDAKEKVGEIKKKMTSTSPSSRSDSKKNNPQKSLISSISPKVSSKEKEQKTSENSARKEEIAARLGKRTLAATTHLEADSQKHPPPNTDPDILQPASKPLHLRSQKPLRKLQVVDVANEGDIPPLKLPKTIKPSSIRGFELEADCITSIAATFTALLSLARQPDAATSTSSSVAAAVVVGEPASVRQMVQAYLEAVTDSRAFELNALFLTSQDKKSILSLLSDLETDSDGLPRKLAATRRLLTE